MKKLILFTLLLIGVITPTIAQRFQLGVKGGGGLSNGVGYDAQNSAIRLDWHAGILAHIRLTEHINWQAEAQYALKGDNALAYGPSIGHQLAYLDVPLLIQYIQDDLFLEIGPRYSYLLTAKANGPGTTGIGRQAFRDATYGFAVGFGYQDPSGVQVGWRYTADLTNMYRGIEYGGDIGRQQTRMRNSTMQLYLGTLFEPKDVVHAAVNTGKFTWKSSKAAVRGSKRLAIGTARLLFVKVPVLVFRSGKFLFYTGPQKLLRTVGGRGDKPANPPVTTPPDPAIPAPAVPTSPN